MLRVVFTDFETVPSDVCASPGDVVDFSCTAVYTIEGVPDLIPAIQEWVITPPSRPATVFNSGQTESLPSGFSFIGPTLEPSGIRVTANSGLNSATIQCIALVPNTGARNDSALAVVLQVAGNAPLIEQSCYKLCNNYYCPPLRRARPVQLWASLLPSSLLTWSGHHVHSAVECTVDCRLCSTHKLHHRSDKKR